MITKKIEVVVEVEVTVDESKFDDDFMREFRSSFYDFKTIDDHIKHLAELKATGCIDDYDKFFEGYGELLGMGIKLSESEVVGVEIYPESGGE